MNLCFAVHSAVQKYVGTLTDCSIRAEFFFFLLWMTKMYSIAHPSKNAGTEVLNNTQHHIGVTENLLMQ